LSRTVRHEGEDPPPESMLYGNVRRIWARKHHPKWYKEVEGE